MMHPPKPAELQQRRIRWQFGLSSQRAKEIAHLAFAERSAR